MTVDGFSALQRAEIAEIVKSWTQSFSTTGFSALQRAEIAEIRRKNGAAVGGRQVSVLFNEPKLLKSLGGGAR